ncbi:MAG TPA: hypothetical protein VKA36_03140, partial [Solirubrobacterales bacterium]|nr:hypothetical protein [Solirubrobacterales bacterium]
MSNRERKRTARRKRKQRSGASRSRAGAGGATSRADDDNGGEPAIADIAAEAEGRNISKSEVRNERAREALEPLAEGERPRVVTVGALLSAVIAAITVGAWVAGAEVDGERPSAFQVFAPATLFGVMAWGMWRARYWAVLGFQAVMALLMVGAFLTLVAATSLLSAITPIVVLAGAGTLFWFTVKA